MACGGRTSRVPGWRSMNGRLERRLADDEMPHRARPVVAVEPVAVVEADDAEQRDLHAEAHPRPDLEVERADVAPRVPHVASVEEEHTVQRVDNGKLLLETGEQHVAPARIADARGPGAVRGRVGVVVVLDLDVADELGG